jgi:hypothetical protein
VRIVILRIVVHSDWEFDSWRLSALILRVILDLAVLEQQRKSTIISLSWISLGCWLSRWTIHALFPIIQVKSGHPLGSFTTILILSDLFPALRTPLVAAIIVYPYATLVIYSLILHLSVLYLLHSLPCSRWLVTFNLRYIL